MNTKRVREELSLRMQNGGLTTQHDTEKRLESFLRMVPTIVIARTFCASSDLLRFPIADAY